MSTLPEISEDGVNINDLDDDCLLHVFSYLTEPQLIGIERVCIRWAGLCSVMWLSKREFVFQWETWQSVTLKFTTKHLWKVLKKCGSHITNLDLHRVNFQYHDLSDHPSVSIIGVICENLKRLDLSNIDLADVDMNFKTFDPEIAQNLITLQLDGCNVDDYDLIEFFKKACNLTEVSLESNSITGDCLVHITSKLKHLNLNKCRSLSHKYFNKAIKKFRDLEILRADRTCISSKIIQWLPKNLTELSIYHVSRKCFLDGPQLLSFPSLKILYVGSNDWFTDAVVSNLSDICPNLEQLNLEDSSNLTQFHRLLKFEKLKVLRLDYCDIDHESFDSLIIGSNGRFNIIGCRNCGLTDEKAVRIIASSPELSCLDIGDDFDLTDEFLTSAFESVSSRTNNIPLTIHGYDIEDNENNQYSHPLLKFDRYNRCQCRNRYVSKCYYEDENSESDTEEEEEDEEYDDDNEGTTEEEEENYDSENDDYDEEDDDNFNDDNGSLSSSSSTSLPSPSFLDISEFSISSSRSKKPCTRCTVL